MSNRYLPYGYEIKYCEIDIVKTEADIVKEMYSMRQKGSSYNTISEYLNANGIMYTEDKRWNKNSVARVLANDHYLGDGRFPKIIETSVESAKPDSPMTRCCERTRNPNDALWGKLTCDRCGSPVWRAGGRAAAKGSIILKCSNRQCGMHFVIASERLLVDGITNAMIKAQTSEYSEPKSDSELMRLQNAVQRDVAQPVDADKTKKEIRELAAVRYERAKKPRVPIVTTENTDRPYEIDWLSFVRAVSHISIDERVDPRIIYTGGKDK